MIDWEKQQRKIKINSLSANDKKLDEMRKSLVRSSAWRSLLVANEFNEIFGLRYIEVEIVYILYAVLMKGFNWENFAANTTTLDKGIGILEQNYVLKFFLSSAVMIVLAAIFYSKNE